MAISTDITRTVEHYCKSPRVRIVNNWNDFDLTDTQLGVVYLLAPWSMWSVQNLTGWAAVMARPDFEHLEFVITNIDTVPEAFFQAAFEGSSPRGAGETLWIREGKIVAASLGYATERAGWELEHRLAEQTERLLIDADN